MGNSNGSSSGEKDFGYEVVSEDVGPDGNPGYYVISSANDLQSLNAVAQDIQQHLLHEGYGSINFVKSRTDVHSSGENLVGMALLFQNETWARIQLSDDSLSSEEVDKVVAATADNGYVWTVVDGKNLPVFPAWFTEQRGSASASATATATATPSASATAIAGTP